MDTAKTTTPTFRNERGLKEALRMPADHDRRSIANMWMVLTRDCGQSSTVIPEQQQFLLTSRSPLQRPTVMTRAHRHTTMIVLQN